MKRKYLFLSCAAFIVAQTTGHAQETPAAAPVGPVIATPIDASQEQHKAGMPFNLDNVAISRTDRAALARVAYAEAGNQGDAGLAAVVFVILNRVACGHFGPTVQSVINAPGQFEPVGRAGGTWRALPPLTAEQQGRFDAIFNLIFSGFLPDPTNGALFFQNPVIVGAREASGQVSAGLTNFGGLSPIATIKDHAFYYADVAARMGVLPATGSPGLLGEVEITPEAAAMFAPLSGTKDKAGKPVSSASDGAIFIALEAKEADPKADDKTTKLHVSETKKSEDGEPEGEKTNPEKSEKKEDKEKEISGTKNPELDTRAGQQIATGNTVPQQTLFVPINSN